MSVVGDGVVVAVVVPGGDDVEGVLVESDAWEEAGAFLWVVEREPEVAVLVECDLVFGDEEGGVSGCVGCGLGRFREGSGRGC